MVGNSLGHYRILDQIGAGGMGVVYRAHDTRLDREVALKVLPAGTVVDEIARRRLRNEARLLSRLNHPNIATIHDSDTADEIDFLVMELVPGETLSEKLAFGPLPPNEVAALGAQLGDAMAAAHRAGIIHRDLKPSNLRVTPDGLLKVLDFGLAQLLPSETATTESDIAAGPRAGTLQYMAPEQLRGAEPSQATDIYSTGAVLYEMALGRPPFSQRPDSALIEAILHGTPDLPSTENRSIPPLLEFVILKALDRDPARRYSKETDLAVDLRRVLSGATSPAPRSRARVLKFAVLGLAAVLSVFAARSFLLKPPPLPPTDASGRLRLAILEPRNLASGSEPNGWPAIVQILLVGELTGVGNLGIMDPSSLNTLFAAPVADLPRAAAMRSLVEAGVALALEGEVLTQGRGYSLRARLVDPTSGESRFSTNADLAGEADLISAARKIAEEVLIYLQVETKAGDQDLRPWIRSHSANLEAVKAFLQANADIYRANTEGEPYLKRAIQLDPDFVAPRVWLAISLNSQGQRAEAAIHYEHLKTLLDKASPFERAMINFTGARLEKDSVRQEEWLTTGLKYSPNNNILLFQLAGLQVAAGRCEEALKTMAPAVAMRWRYRNLYPLWGWCAVHTGRAAEAVPILREAAEFEAASPRTFALLEAIALLMGDDARAAAAKARYEATHPTASVTASLAPLFVDMGRESLRNGRVPEAIRLLRRAAEHDPRNAKIRDELGSALQKAGELRDAEAEFRKAVTLDRTLAHPHLALGELAEAAGRPAEAVGHYRAYLAVETDATKAAVIRERIPRLTKSPGRLL